MSTNENLHTSKRNKNDEYYTRLEDIENELSYYKQHFRDKTIYCNCDDPTRSMFWKYFHINFSSLGLKSLIATFYSESNSSYVMIYEGGNDNDISDGVIRPLKGNGDFKSYECLAILETVDVVVTNPPFSLAREYMDVLMSYKKKFLIVGDMNWIGYKQIFPLLRNNQIWLGNNYIKSFVLPDGSEKKFGNKLWFTNLDIDKRHKPIPLKAQYTREKYPRFDNYDAINVDRVADIPCDYDGVMGVPISFMTQYCPEQFDIVAFRKGADGKDLVYTRERERERVSILSHPCSTSIAGMIKNAEGKICGKITYARITIRKKTSDLLQ